MLCALNRYPAFLGRADCRVRQLKMQKQIYMEEGRTLTRAEYNRLLAAAKGDLRLNKEAPSCASDPRRLW